MVEKENTNTTGIVPAPPVVDIKDLILTIRGVQVLLDSDVARLYGYETKAINQAASRNKKRFPPEFRFQLANEEADWVLRFQNGTLNDQEGESSSRSQIVTLNSDTNLRSQIVTSSHADTEASVQHGGKRYRPFVYTEMGIGMLSGILKNDIAVQVSIGIMKAFVEMRKIMATNRLLFEQITDINNKLLQHDNKLLEQDARIDDILALLSEPETSKQWIFYKGQFYDAFKLVIGFIQQAKTSITIIDNYADDSMLGMLGHKKAKAHASIITANPDKLSQEHLNKFIAQHGQVKVVVNKDFHDRFVILDDKEVYVFGASFKDLGNKCFGVFKSEDSGELLARVNSLI